MTFARVVAASFLGTVLSGCGILVPDIKEVWDADKPETEKTQEVPGAGQIEWQVKTRIFCELEEAVQLVNAKYHEKIGSTSVPYIIPLDFLAQISLSFQVDESSALNPGVVLTQALPNVSQVFGPGNTVTSSQSRSLGFGGTLSSTATRIDKFNPSYTIKYLMTRETKKSICKIRDQFFEGFANSSPFILEGNLGIQKWLEGAVLTDGLIASVPGPAPKTGGGSGGGAGGLKTDAYSYEIKFVIISSGNITPTWKLVQVSANTSGSFFAAGRTRTHDLIITIGPNDMQSLNAHLAAEIGQAVSGATGARLSPNN